MNRIRSYITIAVQLLLVSCSLLTPPDLATSDVVDVESGVPEVRTPNLTIERTDLQAYRIAFCWVATERNALGHARTDVIVESGAGDSSTVVTYPIEPPTTPISIGCYGGDQSIKIGGHGLVWRPNHNQLMMLGTANESRGDNFYSVEVGEIPKNVLTASPIWDHEQFFDDPASISWSSTGEWLATDGTDADGSFGVNIWLYNPDTNEGRQLTDINSLSPYMSSPVWSPDDQYVSFTYGPEPSGIGIIRLSDGKQTDIANDTQNVIAPWRFELGETVGVYDDVITVANTEALQYYLIDNAESQWLAGSKRIIFVAPTSRNRVTLFEIGVDGQNINDILPSLQGLSTSPTLSPDEQNLAFVRYDSWNERDRAEIAIYEVSSGEIRSLVVLPVPANGDELYISGMDWTPDGKYLAFSSNHNGESDIYVISTDGQAWINLTEERQGDALNPVWRP